MMDELLLRALSAGVLVALMTGPLGCFVVWQRMAYFGDTLAHSALLGIGISLFLQVPVSMGVLGFAIALAIVLAWLHHSNGMALDTLLGIIAHATLALGAISLSILSDGQVDWLSYLFGDLLSVSWPDLLNMSAIAIIVLAILVINWRKFVMIAVDAELAKVDGIAIWRNQALLLVLIAATIATAIQVVGVLLVTALLIIPAAAARNLSRSPTQMVAGAMGIGVLSAACGVATSYSVDVSVGPAIVLVAFAVFCLTALFKIKP